MRAFKKVWRYIRKYKGLLFITIAAMIIVQVLNLLAPLIVKSILDDELAGITRPWYETTQDQATVNYDGRYFTQDDTNGNQVTIIIFHGNYYFYDGIIAEGQQSIVQSESGTETNGDVIYTLTVRASEGVTYTYIVSPLSSSQVRSFYQPFFNPILILIALLSIRFILQILFMYIQRRTTAMININIVRDARMDAVASLQRMPMTYFESEPAGKVANRIISDVAGMMNLFSTLMNLMLNATFAVIFAYIGMFYLNSTLAILTFIVFPFIYVWMRIFVKRLNHIAEKVSESNSLITAKLNEIINGINILQVFNYEQQTEAEFNEISDEFRREQLKEVKLHLSIGWNLIRLIGFVATAFVVFYFGHQSLAVSGFVITAGIIYAYNDYLTRLIEPVGVLFREIGNMQMAIVRTERIFKIIDASQEDGSFELLPKYKGHIKFDNVWFGYQEQKYVLNGISLDIEPGQMVGIVGHTGSGKSTMMSLLLRFYDLKPSDMGDIYIDDVNIKTHSKRTYRKDLGIILQEPIIFKGTLASNIRFGTQASDEEIEKVLVSIGGSNLMHKHPDGLNQPLMRGGGNLSLGEKQLISFARVVIHNPSVLIMDEATANIDTQTEQMIQRALNKVKQGRTTIVIAHRLSTIRGADKIVVLEKGVKVEEGKHEVLLANNSVYANIYRSQIKDRVATKQLKEN